MSMVSASASGDFSKTEAWLKRMVSGSIFSQLQRYGQVGVNALSAATPVETGETANAWNYEVVQEKGSYSIIWGNTHTEDGKQIAVLLQYGHGTGTGGYVAGRDYINPALRPVFDQIAEEAWKVVTTA
jgi:hypothetical protein